MAASRARKSFLASDLDLFRWVVQIDPCTVVPDWNALANGSESRPGDRGSPVLYILSGSATPIALDIRAPLLPRYDASARELWLGGFVLRRFSKPAKNQEAILKAFEEEGQQNGGRWPPTIDDPISGSTLDPIKRLHNALDVLNTTIADDAVKAGAPCYIKFATDGTGQGVRWRLVAVARSAPRKRPGRNGLSPAKS
jgi:hypothetical protein